MTLGSVAVRRWATLLVLAGVSDRPSHLLELGLLRARLCELVAARTPGRRARPRVHRRPVLGRRLAARHPHARRCSTTSPSTSARRRALGEHEGPEGRLLAGVLAYERGDFEDCAEAGVSLVDIARAYGEALDWTDGALVQLTA